MTWIATTALVMLLGLALVSRRAWQIKQRDADTINRLIDDNRARARPGMAARDALLMAQAETRARARRPVE